MTRTRVLLAAGTALALLTGAVLVVTTASAAGTVTATFTKEWDWGTGYQAKYTITNGSDATITSWRVEFDLPSSATMGTFWEADITVSGSHVVATNRSYNGTLSPGASTSFGFIVVGSGNPTNCTINGAPCSSGAPPTSATTTSRPPTTTTSRPPTTTTSRPPTTTTSRPPTTTTTSSPPLPGNKVVLAYFVNWGVYARQYFVKNIHTSGTAAKITHINYAFGNVVNGQCAIGDAWADYDMAYTAENSVDGVADTWDPGVLRGNFNQLRKLKQMYPHIKVLWSFGGWTWSGGFTQAAANPVAFAESCYRLVEDPRWADVFDGIDIDWEYPNACGLTCDSSGPAAFRNLMQALRNRFGPNYLVTAAITADGTNGGKIDAADYAGAAQYVNWYNVMTYDYFGAWDADGPTAPHSPLTSYSGIPIPGFYADAAIQKLKSKGIPSNKLLLGIGFYGRGWAGVSQAAPGGSASGPAPGTYEQGVEDYKVLKTRCPATGTIAGTAYAYCGGQWWSYDTPSTIAGKLSYGRAQGLGGVFVWELSGDTSNGELITAVRNNV